MYNNVKCSIYTRLRQPHSKDMLLVYNTTSKYNTYTSHTSIYICITVPLTITITAYTTHYIVSASQYIIPHSGSFKF